MQKRLPMKGAKDTKKEKTVGGDNRGPVFKASFDLDSVVVPAKREYAFA